MKELLFWLPHLTWNSLISVSSNMSVQMFCNAVKRARCIHCYSRLEWHSNRHTTVPRKSEFCCSMSVKVYIFITIYWPDIFKKDFIYLFLERGEEREKEREKNIHAVSHAPPTWDLAHNPGMCPDWESNWWPFGSQAGTQSTEPHQPGLIITL